MTPEREHQLGAALRRILDRLDAIEARLDAIEGARAADARHVPASEAAERLGIDIRTVRRRIERRELLGRALPVPGSDRRRWVVNSAALERLLGADGPSMALPAARGGADSGQTRAGARKG